MDEFWNLDVLPPVLDANRTVVYSVLEQVLFQDCHQLSVSLNTNAKAYANILHCSQVHMETKEHSFQVQLSIPIMHEARR